VRTSTTSSLKARLRRFGAGARLLKEKKKKTKQQTRAAIVRAEQHRYVVACSCSRSAGNISHHLLSSAPRRSAHVCYYASGSAPSLAVAWIMIMIVEASRLCVLCAGLVPMLARDDAMVTVNNMGNGKLRAGRAPHLSPPHRHVRPGPHLSIASICRINSMGIRYASSNRMRRLQTSSARRRCLRLPFLALYRLLPQRASTDARINGDAHWIFCILCAALYWRPPIHLPSLPAILRMPSVPPRARIFAGTLLWPLNFAHLLRRYRTSAAHSTHLHKRTLRIGWWITA